MAITLRGTAENDGGGFGGAFSITHPGGTTTSDVVYVTVTTQNSAGTNVDMTVSTSGYTELADLYANDAFDCNLGVYRKVMGGTPDSTVDIPAAAFGDSNVAVEMVLIGVDTTTPEDATTTTATGTDSAVPDSPSITTATASAWVLSCGAGTNSDAAVTAPSGYSNQVDRNHSTFSAITSTVGMASKEVTSPGAEDPGAWTDWSTSANDSWCAASVAVKPSGGGGGGATEPANASVTFTLATCGVGR